jgi:hypothetical protein
MNSSFLIQMRAQSQHLCGHILALACSTFSTKGHQHKVATFAEKQTRRTTPPTHIVSVFVNRRPKLNTDRK